MSANLRDGTSVEAGSFKVHSSKRSTVFIRSEIFKVAYIR